MRALLFFNSVFFTSVFFLCTVASVSSAQTTNFALELVLAARERTTHFVTYNGAYRKIAYPMGDVPNNIGVCTDVLVRSYRKLGIDLQQLVHEDMRDHFSLYPNIWGLKKPDTNIDHRRVPNLRVFFSRHGQSLPVSNKAADYLPGDIVSWELSRGVPHIGIVSNKRTEDGHPYIIHNIGWGPKEEDRLFAYTISGHYRYQPQIQTEIPTTATATE